MVNISNYNQPCIPLMIWWAKKYKAALFIFWSLAHKTCAGLRVVSVSLKWSLSPLTAPWHAQGVEGFQCYLSEIWLHTHPQTAPAARTAEQLVSKGGYSSGINLLMWNIARKCRTCIFILQVRIQRLPPALLTHIMWNWSEIAQYENYGCRLLHVIKWAFRVMLWKGLWGYTEGPLWDSLLSI